MQGAVRIYKTELPHSVFSVASLAETTLNSATGPFRSDGISIRNVKVNDCPCTLGVVLLPLAQVN